MQIEEVGGRLQGVAYINEQPWYHWPDDGGRTWESKNLGVAGAPSIIMPAWSAAGADHAVIEGGDGATLFPLIALHTADNATVERWTRTALPRDGGSHWTVTGSWVQDEDGLRMHLTRWPDQGSIKNGPLERGIYRVVNGTPVKVHEQPGDAAWEMLAMEYDDEGPIIRFADSDRDHVVRTTDGGATWTSFPAR